MFQPFYHNRYLRSKSRPIVAAIRFGPDGELVILVLAETSVVEEDLKELHDAIWSQALP